MCWNPFNGKLLKALYIEYKQDLDFYQVMKFI